MTVPLAAEGALLTLAQDVSPCAIGEVMAPDGGVLVLAPHPDDETLGCGVAIMDALAAGRDVTVALLTDGGASHPRSREFPPPKLAALRRGEFDAALDALRVGAGGPARLSARAFDLPDTGLDEAARADSSIVAQLRSLAEAIGAKTLWSTWRGDPHCDHKAAAALADRLTDGTMVRADYAVWGRFGDAGSALRVDDIRAIAARRTSAKRRAMACYRSQLTTLVPDDPSGFVMPTALSEHFAESDELFIREPKP